MLHISRHLMGKLKELSRHSRRPSHPEDYGRCATRLARFLFQYRLTPHSSTGLSPTEMLLGRCPRSHLDLIHPDTSVKVTQIQERQKSAHDLHAKLRKFRVEDLVYARNFQGSRVWSPGVVTEISGPHPQ